MTKRKERELFFKLLFITSFHSKEDALEQLQYFTKDQQLSDLDETLHARMQSFQEKEEKIDTIIEQATEGWKLSRIAKVDLTLLRLAVFEMMVEGLDTGIAINEAVELAKEYGSERSYAFVNGVLANIQKVTEWSTL